MKIFIECFPKNWKTKLHALNLRIVKRRIRMILIAKKASFLVPAMIIVLTYITPYKKIKNNRSVIK